MFFIEKKEVLPDKTNLESLNDYRYKKMLDRLSSHIHINKSRDFIDVREIDERYALNLLNWYQGKIFDLCEEINVEPDELLLSNMLTILREKISR